MKCSGITDKGNFRADNQDCFIIEKCDNAKSYVVALCDGMGGANAGGIASNLTNKAFVNYVYSKVLARAKSRIDYNKLLCDACDEVNGVAFEYSHFDDSYAGMGTTLVGGVVKQTGEIYLVNVGDSRGYLIYDGMTRIRQVTRDHSLVQDLCDAGVITPEEARYHPRKNVITRAIGADSDITPDYFEFSMHIGDVLLLCSDGLSNTLTDEEILLTIRKAPTPEEMCSNLLEEALRKEAKDNITVLAVMR